MGWPSKRATAASNRRIGECWAGNAAEDGTPQVFISPVLAESAEVLAVLLHEMVHVATPGDGHKAAFKRLATSLGLAGKMTATHAGDELVKRFKALKLGKYPHSKLTASAGLKQSTRLLKATCECCGYIIRLTWRWVEEGMPTCPQGGEFKLEVK